MTAPDDAANGLITGTIKPCGGGRPMKPARRMSDDELRRLLDAPNGTLEGLAACYRLMGMAPALAAEVLALRAAHQQTDQPADASAALDALIAERVREAVETEREACAKIADDLSTQWWSECKRVFDHHLEGKSDGADDIANAIRARSQKENQ